MDNIPHVHLWHEPSRRKAMSVKSFSGLMFFIGAGLAVLCWPIGWKDYEHLRLDSRKRNYPIVSGHVIDRHMTPYSMGFRRPLLTIQPDGTNVVAHALLICNKLFDFPNQVKFHYAGDPNEEVLLVGEDDPRVVALILAVVPIALPTFLTLLFFYSTRRKRA